MKTALLIGGTAATGVAIARELRARGYELTIYHRGRHEVDELLAFEHIHGDPHQVDAIAQDLGRRSWDVTVATYGRIQHLAHAMRGRTGHFVSVSGTPVVDLRAGVPQAEDHGYVSLADAPSGLRRLVPRIIETEQAVLAGQRSGAYVATVVRYPYVYGPHAVVPMEWHVLRRVLDGRRRWVVQSGGLALGGRCAAPNAARLIGLVLEQPNRSGGEVFHAADSIQYTLREWVALVAAAAGHTFEFVDIPTSLCPLGSASVPMAGETTWMRATDVAAGVLRHQLVVNSKSRMLLGYADVVDAPQWIRATVAHWLAHPPLVDGLDGRMGPADFDYAAEDALLRWWDGVLATAPRAGAAIQRIHPYDHPPDRSLSPGGS